MLLAAADVALRRCVVVCGQAMCRSHAGPCFPRPGRLACEFQRWQVKILRIMRHENIVQLKEVHCSKGVPWSCLVLRFEFWSVKQLTVGGFSTQGEALPRLRIRGEKHARHFRGWNWGQASTKCSLGSRADQDQRRRMYKKPNLLKPTRFSETKCWDNEGSLPNI